MRYKYIEVHIYFVCEVDRERYGAWSEKNIAAHKLFVTNLVFLPWHAPPICLRRPLAPIFAALSYPGYANDEVSSGNRLVAAKYVLYLRELFANGLNVMNVQRNAVDSASSAYRSVRGDRKTSASLIMDPMGMCLPGCTCQTTA